MGYRGRWDTMREARKQEALAWALNPVDKKGRKRKRHKRGEKPQPYKSGWCWIYALADPRTDAWRYIGKSTLPSKRYEQHMADEETNYKKTAWIKLLASKGLKPKLVLIERIRTEFWQERERHWIALHRPNLLNLTAGGDQSNRGEDGQHA